MSVTGLNPGAGLGAQMGGSDATERMQPPSLRDVARLANVSVMTVSNVINGRTARVGKEVAQRVHEVIEEIGYRPQRRGRSLRLQREFAIGLTILHPDRRFLDDPYITQVAAGMSNFLATIGYGLMVNGVQDLKDLETATRRVASFDGLAVMVSGQRSERNQAYRILSKLHCPMLIVQDTPPRGMGAVSSVLQDDRGGAFRLARSLIDLGARRILLVVPSQSWPAVERRRNGILDAAAGRAEVDCLSCDEADFDKTIEAIAQYLGQDQIPDAIMGANDQIGVAAISAAKRCGLSVPKDIMVTGFNAFWFRNLSSPLLTSVTSPAYEIGQEAGRALIARVEQEGGPGQHLVLSVEIANGGTLRRANRR